MFYSPAFLGFGFFELLFILGVLLLPVVVVPIIVLWALPRSKPASGAGQPVTPAASVCWLSVIALVVGVLGLFPNCIVLPPAAILLGYVAGRQVQQSQGRLWGREFALSAIILGCIGLVISVVTILGMVSYLFLVPPPGRWPAESTDMSVNLDVLLSIWSLV